MIVKYVFFLTNYWSTITLLTVNLASDAEFFLEIFREPLAQLVEQQPFKLWVVGSNPTRLTIIYASLSSSLVQDVALSRRKQGFESPQGRQNIWNKFFLLESNIMERPKGGIGVLIINGNEI